MPKTWTLNVTVRRDDVGRIWCYPSGHHYQEPCRNCGAKPSTRCLYVTECQGGTVGPLDRPLCAECVELVPAELLLAAVVDAE